ncbi:MAG: hypothetical protein ACLQU3_09040 [Limisphaerales bacterium]
MNPGYLRDRKAPCHVPSCIDCLFLADGMALFAITSVLLARPRNWNFRNVHLAGFLEDAPRLVNRNPKCPLCSIVEGWFLQRPTCQSGVQVTTGCKSSGMATLSVKDLLSGKEEEIKAHSHK